MKPIYIAPLIAVSLLVLASCTPQPATPATPPPTGTTPRPSPTATPPPTTSQDTAWNKVVDAAKKEGLVTIYAFYYSGDIGRSMARAFQDRYGIRVEILASAGRQTVEKVKVEQAMKQPVADVVNAGVSSATELSLAGLGEKVWQELPSMQDKSVFSIDPVYSPNGDILFSSATLVTPAINTRLVKPDEEPKSYKDFLDPKWKGNLLGLDPRGGGGALFNTIATMKFFKILDDDYWRSLAPNITLFGGSQQEQYRMVGRGEYKVALPSGQSPVAPLIAEGAPMKLLDMEEGIVAQGESTMVVKGARHPNAARLFVDWVMSAEGMETYARASSTDSIRKGVPGYMIPAATLKPKKIINRTWEAAEASNEYQKSGVMEQIFGKK